MEASKILVRSFHLAASRSQVCECRSSTTSRIQITLSTRQRPLPHKSFSISSRPRQDEPAAAKENAPTPLPTSPRTLQTPKQELRSYTRSIQEIIEGYNFKSRLPPRQYESLVVAVTNAEVRLDAPGAHPDSFAPLLKTLQGEVEPILKINLGSSHVAQLIRDVGSQKAIPVPEAPRREPPIRETATQAPSPQATSTRQATPSPQTAPALAPSKPQPSLSKRLDEVMGISRTPPRRERTSFPDAPSEADGGPMHTLAGLMKYYEKSLNNPSAFKSTPETEAQRELTLIVNDRLMEHDKAHRDAAARPNAPGKTLRLKPTLGRTVEISGNFDVTRALRSLEGLCARNRVKQDVQKQRFHVRKGMRKKLLRSSRWRVLFKEGFVAECERVRRMRRQGW